MFEKRKKDVLKKKYCEKNKDKLCYPAIILTPMFGNWTFWPVEK